VYENSPCYPQKICHRATLYSVKQNWLAVVEHAQYVINMSQLEHDRDNAFRLLKVAQNKISLD